MKKLTVLAVVGTVGLFTLSASAGVPSGFESVNFHATIVVENGGKFQKMKVTTDDLLALIDTEFGTSYAKQDGGNGYQLASYGLAEREFVVVDKNGNIVLSDASYSGNYNLYIQPYNDIYGHYAYSYNGSKYNWIMGNTQLYYNSSDNNDSFYINGLMMDKVDYSTDNENYVLNQGQGSINFNDESIYGPIMGAHVNGSGKNVNYPFDY